MNYCMKIHEASVSEKIGLSIISNSCYENFKEYAYALRNYAELCNDNKTAIEYYNMALRIFEANKMNLNVSSVYISLAMIYSYDGNLSSAKNLLKKAINSSYRLDQTAYNGINIAVASSLSTIRFLENELKQVDKAILDTVSGLNSNAYNSLLSIRGIGKVYAAGIMAEIGNIDRFPHNSKLAKYSGLYWKRNQSGEFDSKDKKSSKKSNKYLRYYMVEAAASCVRQNFPFIKDFYDIKYKEVTKHQHKRALVLSARKLERLIFGLLRKNQYYKPLNPVQNSKNT